MPAVQLYSQWALLLCKSFHRVLLCKPNNCSPPGSSVHGILQARTLEWVALPFSRGSSQPRDQTRVSHIAGRFFTVWATWEAPLLWNSGKLISKKSSTETALLVQWLRLHLPVQRERFQSLVRELRSHMPCGQKPRTKNRSNIVTNPVNALKIVLIRNNLGGEKSAVLSLVPEQ